MWAFTFHESNRRQSHCVSASRHLQGGHPGHSVGAASSVVRGHRDGQAVRVPAVATSPRTLQPIRPHAHTLFARTHKGANDSGNTHGVGGARPRTHVPARTSSSAARCSASPASYRTARRGDCPAAFTEESLVGQMTIPKPCITEIAHERRYDLAQRSPCSRHGPLR